LGENYQPPFYKLPLSLGPSPFPALRRKRDTILISANKSQEKRWQRYYKKYIKLP